MGTNGHAEDGVGTQGNVIWLLEQAGACLKGKRRRQQSENIK